MFEPLIPFVKTKAMLKAITFINITDTAVKATVKPKDDKKLSSEKALIKFSRPTKDVFPKVLKRKNDRYIPHINGHTKPIQKAIAVGIRNIGLYRIIALR